MAQDNVTILRGGYEAFAKGDIPAVLEIMDPGIEWVEPGIDGIPESDAGTHRGPAAVAQNVFSSVPENWTEFAVIPEEFVPSGDRVFVLGTFRATSRKTGRSFSAPFIHLVTFRNGKMAKFVNYTDTSAFLQALGYLN